MPKAKSKESLSAPVAVGARKRVMDMVREMGETAVARLLGTSPETLARILAGLNVQSGTRALVERVLEKESAA